MTHQGKDRGRSRKSRTSPPAKHSRGASYKNQRLNLWPAENLDYLMEDYYKELAAKTTVDKDVNKSNLVKKYKIPVTTMWKQIQQIVKGKGHCSGGAGKPRVLSKGKWDKTCMYVNLSSEKLSTKK